MVEGMGQSARVHEAAMMTGGFQRLQITYSRRWRKGSRDEMYYKTGSNVDLYSFVLIFRFCHRFRLLHVAALSYI